jgi:hypothetical protein
VTRIGKIIHIFDPNKKWYSLTNLLFTYSDYGADPADMKKLHAVLSQLSGRNIEEFENHTTVKKKWLMKNRET